MLIVGGSIALMLLITAFFLVNTVADNTRSRVEKELKSLVAREANDVEGFFATYGGDLTGLREGLHKNVRTGLIQTLDDLVLDVGLTRRT